MDPTSDGSYVPAVPVGITPMLIPAELVPEEQTVVAIMGELNRNGEWLLPREFRVLAVMGAARLDLSQVRIGPGVSEIVASAFMGEVTITVPHNLRVECGGHPIIVEFKK